MGDLGRIDTEGYLHLLDREGDMIKSGAFRISTLRVEEALYEHPAVAEAAVLGVPHPVMSSIVGAAITLRYPVTIEELNAFLRDRLARHETPTRTLVLDSLPRNEAGKVLKRELLTLFAASAPGSGHAWTTRRARRAPTAPTEIALSELWRRVLRVREVGMADNFFDLGGDSLRATQLATLAAEEFGIDVPSALAFDAPGLARQAAWIDSARAARATGPSPAAPGSAAEPAPAAIPANSVPLSSLQEYFLRWMHETAPPRAVSAVTVAVRITEELDLPALDRAIREVTSRHEALRTVFRTDGARHLAVVLAECPPDVVHLHAAGHSPAERQAKAAVAAAREVERPFEVGTGPPVRAVTVCLDDHGRDHVFVLAVHHLVADGWSMNVLLRDLAIVYAARRAGRRPPPVPLAPRAADVAGWARERWPAARAHWQRTLRGALPALPDVPGRMPANRFSARSVPVRISVDLAGRLRASGRAHGCTTFMAVLAAWAHVLSNWAGAPEVVLLSPVAGRTRPEFEGVVGCLVQPLLLRVDLRAAPPFCELLARVRRVVLDAVEHQFYPYAEFSRAVPHPAWFRFESWGAVAHFPGLESGPFELPRELMFDWPLPDGETDLGVPELALAEQADGSMAGWLVYNHRAFDRPTVERLAASFLAVAESASGDPARHPGTDPAHPAPTWNS
jgi:acyl carrier protein